MSEQAIYNIECAVLSTVLFSEEYEIKIPFQLNEKYFLHPYTAHVAKIAREAIIKGKNLSLISLKLDDAVKGTQWEVPHVDILAQTPLTAETANEYYKELKAQYIKREAKLV